MVEVSPHLSLAFALCSKPGTYTLLLGAGVSLPAGVPAAWQVLHGLIGDLAVASAQQRPSDPEAWWARTFGAAPTYDGVLGALTNSQEERRHLLAQFFEATPEEREEGKKQPTAAHHAIARLVQLGAVRLILTTNFDLLTETALRQAGVEPVILSTPEAIGGKEPLHAQQCAVIHLHGDYNSPGVLNTQDELGDYDARVDALLDQVFEEYGLVVVGWSAEWDVALRRALERAPARRFATYWVEPGRPKEHARRLIVTRGAVVVTATANQFLGQVADSVHSLTAVSGQRNPLDLPTAVETAKRQLSGAHVAIDLHDRLRAEIGRVASSEPVTTLDFNAASPDEHGRRLRQLEVDTEMLLALVATAAYWGDDSTDRWWFEDIARFAVRPAASGSTALINLVQLPAAAMLYAAGIAAVGARRFDLLVRLLTEPTTTNHHDDRVPIASYLDPSTVLGDHRSHRRLHLLLRPTFAEHLGLGEVAYRDASERFEYFRLLQATFERQQVQSNPHRLELEQRIGELEQKIIRLDPESERRTVTDTDLQRAMEGTRREKKISELRDARKELDRLQIDLRLIQSQQRAGACAILGVPHIRALSRRNIFTSAPAQTLEAEIMREGSSHPILRAGLCGGDVVRLRWSMSAVSGAFDEFAKEAALFELRPGGGIVRSDSFYPDEIGKWAKPDGA